MDKTQRLSGAGGRAEVVRNRYSVRLFPNHRSGSVQGLSGRRIPWVLGGEWYLGGESKSQTAGGAALVHHSYSWQLTVEVKWMAVTGHPGPIHNGTVGRLELAPSRRHTLSDLYILSGYYAVHAS